MRHLFLSALFIPSLARADVPKVVTDIAPVHSLVAMVMGDLGAPFLLVDGASDPHAFQLKPSQATEIESATAIFWIGPEMTPWLERVVEGLASPEASVVLSEVEGVTERTPMFGGEDHADADGHDHGDHDPHIWLDPQNAMAMLEAIAGELATLDPENAATYRGNADLAKDNLRALDAELAAELAAATSRPTIVFHDAYAHFAAHYGLNIVAALAEGDASDPGAAQVAELRNMIVDQKATCVFTEALHSDKLILTLTEGLGTPVGRLDPEGSQLPPSAAVYPDMMRKLVTSYATCGH